MFTEAGLIGLLSNVAILNESDKLKSLQAQPGPTIVLCWMMMIFWETMTGTDSV